MKVKLLLMPLTIVISIALLIWYVYPAFSNGSDGLMDKYSQLKKENAQLADLESKSSNVDSLAAQLANDSEDKATLMEFIPDQVKEEQIMDNLNYLASSGGVALVDISISQPTDSTTSTSNSAAVSVTPDGAASPATPDGTAAPVTPDGAASPATPVSATPTDFSVKYSVAGTYSQVKSLLNKLNSFGRYDDVSSLSIKVQQAQSSQSTSSDAGSQTSSQNAASVADSLQTDFTLTFNYFKPVALSSDANQVFSSNKLDTSVIGQIKSSQNVPVLHLNIGQTGKSDPFIP